MELSIWKLTFGLNLNKAGNDGGLAAGIDFFKTPGWEVEGTLQLLLPWEISIRIAQRV